MDGLKVERKKMYALPHEQSGAAISRRVGALKEDQTVRPRINILNKD